MSLSPHLFLCLPENSLYTYLNKNWYFCLHPGTATILDPNLPLKNSLWNSLKDSKILWLARALLPQDHSHLRQWGYVSSCIDYTSLWLFKQQVEIYVNMTAGWAYCKHYNALKFLGKNPSHILFELCGFVSTHFFYFSSLPEICFLQWNIHYAQFYSAEKEAVSFLPPSFLLEDKHRK